MAPTDEEKRKIPEGLTPDRPKKRVNKPLIEKRRRQRINECLNQLQTLISQLDKDKYKVGRPAKLEKADILEMTVEFVKKTRTNLQVLQKDDSEVHQYSFVAGYRKCMDEIQNFCKENNISAELNASLHDQIELKISQIKPEQAVDLTTKSDKKDLKINEQLQVLANNNPAIQPKYLPQNSASNNTTMAQVQNTSVQIVQRPLNTTGQVTVVCQKEPSTYVLVPAAAICQPIQIPSASPSFPVIVQNGASNYEIKSNMSDKSGQLFPITNTMNNQGQLLMFSNPSLSTKMMNTNLPANISLSSACKPLNSESSTAVSASYFPVVPLPPNSISGTCVSIQSTPLMSTSGSSVFKQSIQPVMSNAVDRLSPNATDMLNNQNQNQNLQNENMWRPW